MNCPWCGFSMYCLDSKKLYFGDVIDIDKHHKDGRSKKYAPNVTSARQRKWGCDNCERRYYSIEILNPTPYSRGGVPKSILEKS